MSGWPPLDLVTILIFLSVENVIANIIIWTESLHASFEKLSQLFKKNKNEVIWTSRTQDMGWTLNSIWVVGQFQLLYCCYNWNLKTVLFNLWLFMKVLGLSLSFLSISTRSKTKFYNSSYDLITEWCSNLNSTSISFLSLALSLSS